MNLSTDPAIAKLQILRVLMDAEIQRVRESIRAELRANYQLLRPEDRQPAGKWGW